MHVPLLLRRRIVPQHPEHMVRALDRGPTQAVLLVQVDVLQNLLPHVDGFGVEDPGAVHRLAADHRQLTARILHQPLPLP